VPSDPPEVIRQQIGKKVGGVSIGRFCYNINYKKNYISNYIREYALLEIEFAFLPIKCFSLKDLIQNDSKEEISGMKQNVINNDLTKLKLVLQDE